MFVSIIESINGVGDLIALIASISKAAKITLIKDPTFLLTDLDAYLYLAIVLMVFLTMYTTILYP